MRYIVAITISLLIFDFLNTERFKSFHLNVMDFSFFCFFPCQSGKHNSAMSTAIFCCRWLRTIRCVDVETFAILLQR
jgi:hypothetical protein